jgi:ribonuclease D
VALAEAAKLPVENLLTPDFMRQLAWQPPTQISKESVEEALLAFGARKWQVEICGEPFANALLSVDAPSETES